MIVEIPREGNKEDLRNIGEPKGWRCRCFGVVDGEKYETSSWKVTSVKVI